MKVIEDKQDRFGNFPIWFNSHNLKDISEWLYGRYNGFKFAIVIDVSQEVDGDVLEKPLPVYFMGDIAEEVAQEADKKLVDKKEYEGLTKKQIPQKPVYGYDEQDNILCPVCKETVGQMDDYYFGRNKYCPECGQRIDWGN
mgnify:CR=1 FL=1